jgi:diguanylate cyclase (GGDEF)-like protein
MKPGVSDLLLHIQNEILEAVAYNDKLDEIANTLCLRIENLIPGTICSFLTVDSDGKLRSLASPSLPSSYSDAFDGLEIGPSVGSCGTAAYRGEVVIVTDIATDPLWKNFKDLALPLGLRACWSSPIKSQDGRVVGTFAFYYKEVKGPGELEKRIVQTCTHLCAIAIEHEEVQLRNHELAYSDPLTGLLNRKHFDEVLAQRISEKISIGLLLINIDDLKSVNDTMGHMAGDHLLKSVAQLIASGPIGLPPYRLNSDEFAVIVEPCNTREELDVAANDILDRTGIQIPLGAETLVPSVTIGSALLDAESLDVDTLRQNADFALHHAKETNRGGHVHFRPELRTTIIERINVMRFVDAALSDDRITAHYQPIVRLDTAEIIGLEALVRLKKPDEGIAQAGEFAAAFTNPKIAAKITETMMGLVANDIRHWLDLGIPVQHVGINVGMADFQHGDIQDKLEKSFVSAHVPLTHIILEINESMFMDGSDRVVANTMRDLRGKGLLIALDDFGTGFASLTHLMTFPVDIIKIDRSFIENLVKGNPNSIIVAAIVDIATRLDIRLVAEGIEALDQVRYLCELGCHLGQGYYFGKPCAAAETTLLLQGQTQAIDEMLYRPFMM